MSFSLAKLKADLREQGLEKDFLKVAGLDSLDELSPKSFAEFKDSVPPPVKQVPVPDSSPQEQKELKKEDADASPSAAPSAASDMLAPYLGTNILYASRKKVSSYFPSSAMMFYIVHLINSFLVDNFYFKRYAPDYHPYILRLYFGMIFIIQHLRAAHDARQLDHESHEFLTRFLANYPPASLPIPGPLLALFKTICSSNPEIKSYGKVYPQTFTNPGPAQRNEFASNVANMLNYPQIPAIIALLKHLNSVINAAQPTYPKKGKHFPVTSDATQEQVFGHKTFPIPANRTDRDKWQLVCSGIEYPCEADAKLNEAFSERYDNFDIPTTDGADSLTTYAEFCSMDKGMNWFSTIVDVAAAASVYFEGSGTLADCSPFGLTCNQILVTYANTAAVLPAPTHVGDKKSLFPFAFHLSTSARSLPALSEAMACMAQTHVHYPRNHPIASHLGDHTGRSGQFWAIRPLEKSSVDEESHNALPGVVKKMMKSRV